MKKFLIAAVAALALAAVGTTASAQRGGGGSHGGGGGMSSHSGGGGGWHGGSGGSWHGGSGGSWHGGGGSWHGGHDGHSHFGFAVGFPFYWPYYYGYYPYGYYPYYGYPYYDGYSSYYDAGPQTYIQRDTGDAIAPSAPPQGQFSSPQRSQYSYYCTDPAGYFPQVANCPSGWLTVVPNTAPRTAPAPY